MPQADPIRDWTDELSEEMTFVVHDVFLLSVAAGARRDPDRNTDFIFLLDRSAGETRAYPRRASCHGRFASAPSLLMSAAVPVPPSWPSDPKDTIAYGPRSAGAR